MPEPDNILDVDFDSELQDLFKQAEENIAEQNGKKAEPSNSLSTGMEMALALRPVLLAIEAMARATKENTIALDRLEKANGADLESREALPQVVSALRGMLETKSGISQGMFSALHQELKGYKDDFLLQSVHRPIIRDLIALYDDLAEIRRQLADVICEEKRTAAEAPTSAPLLTRICTLEVNVGHNLEFITEVLARLEVTLLPNTPGKLDKLCQRAIDVEPAASAEEDATIVRSLKPGFLWNDRILRPEEVIVKRWRSGPAPVSGPVADKP